MPFPLIPAILGGTALAGGLMSALGHKKPSSVKQIPRFSPDQTSMMNQLGQRGMQALDFGPVEQRARTQFQTQTVPSLAERFTSMGGGQRSSAFQGALGGAGSDLESQLANLRYQYGLPMLQLGLQPQFESIYRPSQPGAMQSFGSSLFGGAMSALPSTLGAWGQESALGTLGKMQTQPASMNNLMAKIQELEAKLKSLGA